MYTKRYSNPLGAGFYTVRLKLLNNETKFVISLETPDKTILFGRTPNHILTVPYGQTRKAVFTEALFWLTLQPGDTDEEFFEDYTEEELKFAKSPECEYLALYTEESE